MKIVFSFKQKRRVHMRNIKTLGIDLAKNVFQLHGIDAKGRCVLRKRLSRSQLIEFVANLATCTIAIEACTGAHYWARLFTARGHTVKMMAPQFVKPYVQSNKNDRNDARGIAEASTRPDMKFVPLKTIEQQEVLLLHRARQLVIKQRTAQGNQIRGLLAEYGIILAKNIAHLEKVPALLEEHSDKLTPRAIDLFKKLYAQFQRYVQEVEEYDKQIEHVAKQDARCCELMKIEGIGPLTASAAVATIGDAKAFKNGREVSAWLGLVPKQHSSGEKIRLGGISKRGDRYLRTLLIHGGRAVVNTCANKLDSRSLWISSKKNRCGYNKAAVAVANKNARIIWAILATGECYRLPRVVNGQSEETVPTFSLPRATNSIPAVGFNSLGN
jgi:transposase